ncbi:MAG: polysaccharide pyruvyl transferase family protein, partial [Pseudomonadota bacterium]|nr:polysaccharide pyruvyl transferase family protein [Pseudomonadota bacterium]
QEACALAGAKLISPIAAPAEVLERLLSVDLIVAESLHGAILADTYGVPWVAFASSGNFSMFKWTDWAVSVDVALNPMMLPPPSAAPVLRFGRPFGKRWGQRVIYDEDSAVRQFAHRCDPSWRSRRANGQIRAWLKRSRLPAAALDRMLSFSPERTAEMIGQAARLEPNLSREGRREQLRERMLDRLDKLCQSAGARVRI